MFSSNTSQVSGDAVYIEDVFSTYLYTGNGSTQTITNGIDLSTKGGLVWLKSRSLSAVHTLVDTARGSGKTLFSDLTNAQATNNAVTAFNSNGFTMGDYNNTSPDTFVSWTFRKQPKFFDVVTYTGNGVAGRTVAHSLGSVPGCIIVKQTSGTEPWAVYHRSLGNNALIYLNYDDAQFTPNSTWNTTSPTSTEFTVGTAGVVNTNGSTYVAYLFAHDAGGFGLTGTDNVISCGSFTTDGSGNATINLGYEPQWFLRKRTDDVGSWTLVDNMRGFTADGTDAFLYPNLSNAEATSGGSERLTSTGVQITGFGASMTFIYIAIRRGPMKTPTTGTSVYEGTAYTGNGASNRQIGSSVLTDLLMLNNRDATAQSWSTYAQMFFDRLRGDSVSLATANTNAESSGWGSYMDFDMNAGWDTGTTTQQTYLNKTSSTYVSHAFRRAPGFFDVVCYTGTGSATTFNHNLGVAPELVIVKWRTGATGESWAVMCTTASSSPDRRRLFLDLNAAGGGLNGYFADSSGTPVLPTATQVYIGTNEAVNKSAATYVAYLFATVAGVSKVGSYTGTGSTLQIDCGFTGGARFVLIKRTDSTGDWYVWDSARGIVSGNDPYLLLNSTAAEVTNTDYVDTYSAGFEISSTAPAAINANGGTFVFLAVA